jgi:hypothetical protein
MGHMTFTEAKIFPPDPTSYTEAYRDLREFEERYRLKLEIGKKIERRFGRAFDDPEMDFNKHDYEVLMVTRKVVGGEIKQEITGEYNTKIVNIFDIVEAKISSPRIHWYVLDPGGKVWNPNTRTWGTMTEKEYLKKKVYKKP